MWHLVYSHHTHNQNTWSMVEHLVATYHEYCLLTYSSFKTVIPLLPYSSECPSTSTSFIAVPSSSQALSTFYHSSASSSVCPAFLLSYKTLISSTFYLITYQYRQYFCPWEVFVTSPQPLVTSVLAKLGTVVLEVSILELVPTSASCSRLSSACVSCI